LQKVEFNGISELFRCLKVPGKESADEEVPHTYAGRFATADLSV